MNNKIIQDALNDEMMELDEGDDNNNEIEESSAEPVVVTVGKKKSY